MKKIHVLHPIIGTKVTAHWFSYRTNFRRAARRIQVNNRSAKNSQEDFPIGFIRRDIQCFFLKISLHGHSRGSHLCPQGSYT